MKIFIDAGHNWSGCDTGAISNGVREQDLTFIIAKKLNTLLSLSGHEVYMSRNKLEDNIGTSVTDSLKKRCIMSDVWGADLFISIHTNAGGGKGTETYVYNKKSRSYDTALRIQKEITTTLGTIDRGVKEKESLYVLRNVKAPAILVETAFLDNDEDRDKLLYKADDFALAIKRGITGEEVIDEITKVNDIVWELMHRGIISDKDLWLKKFKDDTNAYWLARKMLHYIRSNDI